MFGDAELDGEDVVGARLIDAADLVPESTAMALAMNEGVAR